MTELDAVNDLLASVGEFPVDSLSDPNPLVASSQRILAQTLRRAQTRGWWFNSRDRVLPVGTDPAFPLRVQIPTDALSVDPVRRTSDFVQRGGYLFDRKLGTFDIGSDVECHTKDLLPIQDLPETAAAYFTALACIRMSKAYDGDTAKLKTLEQEAMMAREPFHAEHIRNCDVNLFESGTTGRVLSVAYGHRVPYFPF